MAVERTPLRVLIAPDSFKGTIAAADVAGTLAAAWHQARPKDVIRTLPLADGGEGTVAAYASALDGEVQRTTVWGPGGHATSVPWLALPDDVAVVELAACCGLPLMRVLDPLGADTQPLGALLGHVIDAGARQVLVGLGGSASTDAGMGALRSLGARLLNDRGHELHAGGGALASLARIDLSGLRPPPPSVHLLTDVTNPLCGPRGAAAVFAPQKGASAKDVELLERAMRRVRDVVGAPDIPGSGAAGGTAYGLASLWGGEIANGATRLMEIAGFDAALAEADLVITGEGSFDTQSLDGKLVGTVLTRARAARTEAVVIAGRVDPAVSRSTRTLSLTDLAGSTGSALSEPGRWLTEAAARLAHAERSAP